MPYQLQKVGPLGLKTIPVAAYNAFIDATNDYKRRRGSTTFDSATASLDSGTVYIRNGTADDLDRFAILGIDAPIQTPDGDDSAATRVFADSVKLNGITPAVPDHLGLFVILQNPLPSESVGIGLVSGVSIVKLNVLDEAHTFADVGDGSTDGLVTGGLGAAQILWKESGTGTGKWAVVRVGLPLPMPTARYQVLTPIDDTLVPIWTAPRFCDTDA